MNQVYFQSEEDKNTAIFPKVVVVVGLTLTCINILMLPYDVANARTRSSIPVDLLWVILYVIIAVWSIGVIPFTIFYYEAEDPNRG
jgi:LMBR1 domain-containing protein 1